MLITGPVISSLTDSATEPRELVAALDPTLGGELNPSYPVGSVQHCLLNMIREELSSRPFIPVFDESSVRSIEDIVLPHTSEKLSNLGQQYARAVGQSTVSIDESRCWIPAQPLLDHTTVRALAFLGADDLDIGDIPYTIAKSSAEPELDVYETETERDDGEVERCTLWVDPVLNVLIRTRKTFEADDDREALDEACRSAAVFPKEIVGGGDTHEVAERIPTAEETPFFPPQEHIHSDAIPGIQFLPRKLYHGTDPELAQSLRKKHAPDLKTQLEATWGVQEYEFDAIFDSAISPRLPGPRSTNVDTTPLEERETLEAVRDLAAVRSGEHGRSPDDPLLYKSSRRPYQALSRLRVPARSLSDEETVQWRPAHEVYFSTPWPDERYDNERVQSESLLRKLARYIDGFDPVFLVEPGWFDAEKDEEEMRSWYDFFLWLGVAEHLRLLPFFPPGSQHSYKQTGSLSCPDKSAIAEGDLEDERYSRLEESEWQAYRDHLKQAFDAPAEDQYIHQINPLEYGEEIREVLSSEEVPDQVRNLFLDHLADWWDGGFDRFQHPQLAEFTNDNWRGRSTNRYFKKGELREVGWNLWLWQLQRSAWVPTTHGKMEPRRAWLPEKDEVRRFTLGETTLLPIIEYESRNFREVAPPLEFGVDPEESFTPLDAVYILRRAAEEYEEQEDGIEGAVERVYGRVARYMGNPGEESAWDLQGRQFRVLCYHGPGSYTLDPESGPYYARSHRERELYENLEVPMVNLFKDDRSIRFGECIGATDVREGIQVEPKPGIVHDDLRVDIDGFQLTPEWIKTVLSGFLLRLQIDRPVGSEDLDSTQRFYDKLTFVENLVLTPTRTAPDDTPIDVRNYYIERDGDDNKILIDRCLTGDEFKEALAMAYTEYLNVSSHYEGTIRIMETAFQNDEPGIEIVDNLSAVGSSATVQELQDIPIVEERERSEDDTRNESGTPETTDNEKTDNVSVAEVDQNSEPKQRTLRAERVPDPASIRRIGDGIVSTSDYSDTPDDRRSRSGGEGGQLARIPTGDYREKIDSFGMTAVKQWEAKRIDGDPAKRIWDVSKAEAYEDLVDGASNEAQSLREAIERFGQGLEDSSTNPLEAPWPGFDVLTLKRDNGRYEIDRCIELKTTARKTYKPGISWNQWKAASGSLRNHFYLYLVRNVRKGKSGEAELLEVPHPFWTLTKKTREQRNLQVQFNLRDFDSENEDIWRHSIEWEE